MLDKTIIFDYLALGWHVLPCHSIHFPDGHCSCRNKFCRSPGKHPRTFQGVKDATNDAEIVRRWWDKWPDANVGIRTGKESGIWVLDIDGDYDYSMFLPSEDPIMIVKTGGGGKHLYFTYSRKVLNRVKLGGLNIDIRGDGGYVIAPPSNHMNGSYLLIKA